jgi:hypothetical protein
VRQTDLYYPTILIGGFSAAITFLLWMAVRLLREILAELRRVRETIRSAASSDIELRIFGGDDD